ncbi:unnamed protein product [Symbiodinium natans]|uniref:Uncharacterized protein n=1 Tax=Symbiodinium natans TaxID=878477 RepID=A0A812RWN8_9DINO|nr:unnamed protein product [Symbiodinium natans]
MVQPLTVLQWVSLTLLTLHPAGVVEADLFESDFADRKPWLDSFNRILAGYNDKVENEGIEVLPAKKKRKRAGRAPAQSADGQTEGTGDQESVKLGTLRQQAIKNILMGWTKRAWLLASSHVSWAQGATSSALSDAVLTWKFLYTGSDTPPSWRPTDCQSLAAQQARPCRNSSN